MFAAIRAQARLMIDIWSIKVLVWMFGENGELLDSHLFFFDRYSELSELHRRSGRFFKADVLAAIAEVHYKAAPGDDDDDPKDRKSTRLNSSHLGISYAVFSYRALHSFPTRRSSDLIKVLVWMFGENGELLDSHLFFFDRYSELSELHRRSGRFFKADVLAAIAEVHYKAAPGDDDDDP